MRWETGTILLLSLSDGTWGFAINKVSSGCYLWLSSKPPAARVVLRTSSCSLVFLARLVCKLEPGFLAVVCAARPVGCRRCYWIGKLPSHSRVLPPVTSGWWRDRLRGKERVPCCGCCGRGACRLMGPLYVPGPSVPLFGCNRVPLPSVWGRAPDVPGCEPGPVFAGTTGSNLHMLPRALWSLLMLSYLPRSVHAGLLAEALSCFVCGGNNIL